MYILEPCPPPLHNYPSPTTTQWGQGVLATHSYLPPLEVRQGPGVSQRWEPAETRQRYHHHLQVPGCLYQYPNCTHCLSCKLPQTKASAQWTGTVNRRLSAVRKRTRPLRWDTVKGLDWTSLWLVTPAGLCPGTHKNLKKGVLALQTS